MPACKRSNAGRSARARSLSTSAKQSQVDVAGGLVAVRRTNAVSGNKLVVRPLDGSGLSPIVDGQHGEFGWAFDGTRLAWVAQPCAQPQIQVWDLSGPPPLPATDRCIPARLAAAPLKLNRAGTRFEVRVTCPASATRGCAVEIGADVLAGGRKRVETYWQQYRIRPVRPTPRPCGSSATIACAARRS